MAEAFPRSFALIGPGRAGGSLALALAAAGVECVGVAGPAPDHAGAAVLADRLVAPVRTVDHVADGAELLVITVPDDAIRGAAALAQPGIGPGTLVVHCSGLAPLDALPLRAIAAKGAAGAALHPLQTLPDAERGAALLAGSWAAVAGDDRVSDVARRLGLRPFPVSDESRARYHAAACVASNHLVVLLAQVDRLGGGADVPTEAFTPLIRSTLDNVDAIGPVAALTGPVARGDVETVARHLATLDAEERALYLPLARGALDLVAEPHPGMRELLDSAR